jgi:opacity protein-like surface antigen
MQISPKSLRRVIVLCALLALAAVPASATEWYLYVEAGSIEPTNAFLSAGNIEDENVDPNTNTTIEVEPGSEFTGRLGFGFGLGDGVLGVSYWQYSGDDRRSDRMDDFDQYFDTMSGLEWGDTIDTDIETFGEIEASIIDVAYYFSGGGEKVRTSYHLGLTLVEYEETIDLLIDDDFEGETIKETYNLETEGIGVSLGGAVEYKIGESFGIFGHAGARIIMGDTDEALRERSTDEDGDDLFFDRDSSGIIWDLGVGATLYQNDLVKVGLEYQISSWNNIVQRQAFGADDIEDPHGVTRDNVTFHGFVLSALFKFGGDA